MSITPLLIDESEEAWKAIFLIQSDTYDKIAYGCLLYYHESQHFCAYLNVDKAEWLSVADQIRDRDSITFEAIESIKLSIPVSLYRHVPVSVHTYWIGVDYMGITPQPKIEDMTQRLLTILEHFAEAREALTHG